MEAEEAQSKSTKSARSLRKRGKRGGIGRWIEGRGRRDPVRGNWKHKSNEGGMEVEEEKESQ